MQRAAAVAGLMLFSMVGAAYADSPGGWSQFNDLVIHGQPKVAQAQQLHQTTPVYELPTGQKRGTWVSRKIPTAAQRTKPSTLAQRAVLQRCRERQGSLDVANPGVSDTGIAKS